MKLCLWRGMDRADVERLIVSDGYSAYLSATLNRNIGERFANSHTNPALVAIHASRSVHAIDVSAIIKRNVGGQEVILARNTPLRFLHMTGDIKDLPIYHFAA